MCLAGLLKENMLVIDDMSPCSRQDLPCAAPLQFARRQQHCMFRDYQMTCESQAGKMLIQTTATQAQNALLILHWKLLPHVCKKCDLCGINIPKVFRASFYMTYDI